METYQSGYFHPSGTLISIYVIVAVLEIAGLWKIFEKAGRPGWAAIIPFYNLIVLVQIVGKPIWWFLLFLVPCLNIVFIPWTCNLLSKSFGKDIGYTLGIIFFPFIFLPILGFGDATYVGPGGAPFNFGADDYQKPFDINPES